MPDNTAEHQTQLEDATINPLYAPATTFVFHLHPLRLEPGQLDLQSRAVTTTLQLYS